MTEEPGAIEPANADGSRTSGSGRSGFTVPELLLVIVIIGLAIGLLSTRLGVIDAWRENAAFRRLQETIVFLNNQAVMDQVFYRMEFDLEKRQYRVGVMRPDDRVMENLSGHNLPPLQLELATILSPSVDGESTMIPPPSMPSLANPIQLPGEMYFEDVVTPRGKAVSGEKRSNPFLLFSPRNASEFGVIHVQMGSGKQFTILVNPWTGLAEVFPEHKDFQYNLGRQAQNS